MIRGIVASLLIFGLPSVALAQADLEELARQAVEAYATALDTPERERRVDGFRRAQLRFSKLADAGVCNADLYTNLGNAALQAEDLGRAVLAYRRALRLDPDHRRAGQNLAHARGLLPAWVPRPEESGLFDTFFFWHRTVSRGERFLGAALLFAGAGLLAAAGIRWKQALLRNLSVVLGLGWMMLWGSLISEAYTREGTAAVVTAEEVVARAADSALAASPFGAPLPGGTELRVIERRPPFARVRLANGSDAWVSEASLTSIGPGDASGDVTGLP
jgi:tetratricopeptide (TPR) repeat protein